MRNEAEESPKAGPSGCNKKRKERYEQAAVPLGQRDCGTLDGSVRPVSPGSQVDPAVCYCIRHGGTHVVMVDACRLPLQDLGVFDLSDLNPSRISSAGNRSKREEAFWVAHLQTMLSLLDAAELRC